jgi:hypothetical protein
MVKFQDSILKSLHCHTFSNMFFNGTSKAHCVQILSCFGLGVGAWLIIWPIFRAFLLSSPFFSTTFHTWFGLSHPLIVGIPQCVCTHPIEPMGIHFLHCVHDNKRTRTHDIIRDTFVAIAWNDGFHMGWKQLHAFLSITFNSSCLQINIVLTKDGIHILVDIVIVDSMRTDLRPWSCATQGFVTFDVT